MLESFEEVSVTSAVAAHDAVSAELGIRVLNVDLIDRLYERYGASTDSLKLFLREAVEQAGTYATFDSNETGKTAIPGRDDMFTTHTFVVPRSEKHPQFAEQIADYLQEAAQPRVGRSAKEVLHSTNRSNEIVILNVASSFPLRYLGQLTYLREDYQNKIGTEKGQIALHLEGDGSVLPKLYHETDATEVRPYLLLAEALGLLDRVEDERGKEVYEYVIRDQRGRPINRVDLGATLVDAETNVDPGLADRLKRAVSDQLQDEKYMPHAARDELQTKVDDRCRAIESASRNRDISRWWDASRKTEQLLKLV
ncbi:MAG: hypothetical protein AAGG50_06225 [Bacteroidota bacterium]